MSHWHSGLPKLDIEPFDPTPLYDAVRSTQAEQAVVTRRRRSALRVVGGLTIVFGVCLAAGWAVSALL
ncbi:hypothetical protein [Arthrobacter sp. NEB 688]|uniref:hypothetical protein n=1 Tax=Arthrobacter sp. NEB 688 TaxID=904039 RepID=UPI00156752E7|nr:hypothetical protein [Arthrobacter sp. NEB 688]QKE85241.1 hypothetical protein HL663_15700 [Arthrobacter sp. NEB 688]